jgi:hypothetical protein
MGVTLGEGFDYRPKAVPGGIDEEVNVRRRPERLARARDIRPQPGLGPPLPASQPAAGPVLVNNPEKGRIMNRSKLYLVGALIIAAMAGWMLSAPLVLAQNYPAVSLPRALSAEEADRVEAFWTQERMDQAIPMPMLQRNPSGQQAAASVTINPIGPRLVARSGLPGDKPVQQRSPATAMTITNPAGQADIQPLYSGGASPFTRYRVFPDLKARTYQHFPHKLIGKLYFLGYDGLGYVASASVVNSANLSVVWTAGHCVYTNTLVDPDHVGWNSSWYFYPAEYQGRTKYKGWPAVGAVTSEGWTNNYWEYDVGALVIAPRRNGPIGVVLGFLGIMFNAPYSQNWTSVGYPAVPQSGGPPGYTFDGEHQESCNATLGVTDMGTNGPPTMGVGCDQTPGCSGGPWIIDFNGVPGDDNYVNGHFSYKYEGAPLSSYSPYFGDAAYNVWNRAQTQIP